MLALLLGQKICLASLWVELRDYQGSQTDLPRHLLPGLDLTHQFRLLGNAVTLQPARDIMRECKRVVHIAYNQSKRQKV